jgi:hypothetical protein
MADEITTNLELTLPEVGASASTWGAKWNGNGEKLDAFAGNVIGRGTLLTSANDLNAVLTPGRYYWASASIPSNVPPAGLGGLSLLEVVPVDVNAVRQDLTVRTLVNAPETWSRYVGNIEAGGAVFGTTAWREDYSQTNIVGVVSQSGGRATGSVFQSSSNANGSYTRFADGTQICRHVFTESAAINVAHFGGFRSPEQVWTFPIAFSAAPEVTVTAWNISAFGATGLGLPSVISGRFAWTSIDFQGVAPRTAMVQAVGRWF